MIVSYLDLCALRDTGETVTGNPYVALAHGPVVASYRPPGVFAPEP